KCQPDAIFASLAMCSARKARLTPIRPCRVRPGLMGGTLPSKAGALPSPDASMRVIRMSADQDWRASARPQLWANPGPTLGQPWADPGATVGQPWGRDVQR